MYSQIFKKQPLERPYDRVDSFMNYSLCCEKGIPSFEKRIRRGIIFGSDNKQILEYPSTPIQILFDSRQNLETNLFLECELNSVNIYCTILKDTFENNLMFVTTNQKLNAYQSRFGLPFSNESSFGDLFETCLRRFENKNFFDNYTKHNVFNEKYKNVDVWFIREESKGNVPYSNETNANYAYSINPESEIYFKDTNHLLNFETIVEKFKNAEKNNEPYSVYYFSKINQDEPLNVSNTRMIKLVNSKHIEIQNALGNQPNLVKRIIDVYKNWICSTPYYDSSFVNNFKIEENLIENGEKYLENICIFNPTLFWATFLLLNLYIDKISTMYQKFVDCKIKKLPKNIDSNSYESKLINHLNLRWNFMRKNTKERVRITRAIIEDVMFCTMDSNLIFELVIKEIGNNFIHPSKKTLNILTTMLKFGNCEQIKKIFKNYTVIKDLYSDNIIIPENDVLSNFFNLNLKFSNSKKLFDEFEFEDLDFPTLS